MSELKPGIPFVQINIESPKDPPSGDFILSEEEAEASAAEEASALTKEEGEEEEEEISNTEDDEEGVPQENQELLDEDDLQEVVVTQDTTEERWQEEKEKPALEGENPIDSWQSPSTWKIYRNPTNISNDYYELDYYSMNSESLSMPTICFLEITINFFKLIGKFY